MGDPLAMKSNFSTKDFFFIRTSGSSDLLTSSHHVFTNSESTKHYFLPWNLSFVLISPKLIYSKIKIDLKMPILLLILIEKATSKNETTNSPINEFKVLQYVRPESLLKHLLMFCYLLLYALLFHFKGSKLVNSWFRFFDVTNRLNITNM